LVTPWWHLANSSWWTRAVCVGVDSAGPVKVHAFQPEVTHVSAPLQALGTHNTGGGGGSNGGGSTAGKGVSLKPGQGIAAAASYFSEELPSVKVDADLEVRLALDCTPNGDAVDASPAPPILAW